MAADPDPYQTLGLSPGASDEEMRAAYRRLVQLHHPDHNAGSLASARRFEEVQEAYAQIRKRRQTAPRTPPPPPRAGASTGGGAHASADPAADARLADLEREIREAHRARERARQAARAAAAAAENVRRPSPEELGYVTTDDSLGKILSDARAQASERFAGVPKRVADLLDDVASKLSGGPPSPSGK